MQISTFLLSQKVYEPSYYVKIHFQVLTKTIEGLGQHGMVGTSEKPLINLHDGLRLELQKVIYIFDFWPNFQTIDVK